MGNLQPTAKPWERHLQSILSALVLGGVLWLGASAIDNGKTIAVMANDCLRNTA